MNPISLLQEECASKGWTYPIYKVERIDGPPHRRVFTVSCSLQTRKEMETGTTKKMAKQGAALKMYNYCKYIHPNGINIRPNSAPENGRPCWIAHKNFMTAAARMLSYANINCPFSSSRCKELAEAGFFYTGFRDHTICFSCGLGLCNWQENDNPIEEHKKYNYYCNNYLYYYCNN